MSRNLISYFSSKIFFRADADVIDEPDKSSSFTSYLNSIRFFAPSKIITKTIADLMDEERYKDFQQVLSKKDIEQVEISDDKIIPIESLINKNDVNKLQIFISEQIYHCLAMLSREKESRQPFEIGKFISSEIAEITGLSGRKDFIEGLTNEFIDWLKKQGEVTTPWGKILYADGDKMYVTSFDIKDKTQSFSPDRILIPNPKGARIKKSKKANAKGSP